MALTVLSVAFPFAPVGPDAVGGAEQILTHVDAALVRAGHRSLVICSEDSHPAGVHVRTHVPTGVLDMATRKEVKEQHRRNIERTLRWEQVDLVHMHGIDFLDYLPDANVPVLVTLHLPPGWYPREIWKISRPDTWLQCVSKSQRRMCPPTDLMLNEIENGVSVPPAFPGQSRESFALCLGRICPEKNFHVALDAGRRAGIPVLLGGRVFPYAEHQRYHIEQILPRLDRDRRFLGPLKIPDRLDLLRRARCVLIPSLAPETSSLVAMEALAAGTPVIAFNSGALPEIIEDGVTGFLVKNEAEMAEAIAKVDRIDPRRCYEAARARFSAERMIDGYFELYGQIAAGIRYALAS